MEQLHEEGKSAREIRKYLEERHGVTVADSTWHGYLAKLREEGVDLVGMHTNGARLPIAGQGQPGHVQDAAALPVDTFIALLNATSGELTDRFAEVIEAVRRLETESATRQAEISASMRGVDTAGVQDTLNRHTAAFEAMLDGLESTANWRAWMRMTLITGTITGALWGLALWAWPLYKHLLF
jgi:hypothetical protein